MNRFFEKILVGDQCWEWQGHKVGGYGRIKISQKNVAAHRLSWEIRFGPIPLGLFVLHKCDNHGCVKPSHLFLGTQQDNMADMVAKGRSATCGNATMQVCGALHWAAKLTDENVRHMRESFARGVPQQIIADTYKINQGTVSAIVNRKRWRHVE